MGCRLTLHSTRNTPRAWCKQRLPGSQDPGMLRRGIAGMRWSFVCQSAATPDTECLPLWASRSFALLARDVCLVG